MAEFRALERRLWVTALLVSLLMAPAIVTANHSNDYSPWWYWERTGNSTADDPEPFRVGGCCWDDSPGRRDRVIEAVAHWRDQTDFDVSLANVDNNYILIDGRLPACQPGWSSWPSAFAAEACTYGLHRTTFYQIYESDFYFNTTSSGPIWDWGNSYLGSPGPSGRRHFRGVLTHEIGHSVYLFDLDSGDPAGGQDTCGEGGTAAYPGSSVATMCGTMLTWVDSWWVRDLLNDDKASANAMYP